MDKQRAQKERLQLTQDADAQERSQARDPSVQASIGFVGHDYARAAIQSDSGSRVPSGTSGYLWNQKAAASNNKNRGEEIRWVNYQATY